MIPTAGRSCKVFAVNARPRPNYLLTQAGIFLAFTWPVFFLSTLLGSRVMQPASTRSVSISHDIGGTTQGISLTLPQRGLQGRLMSHETLCDGKRQGLRLPGSATPLDKSPDVVLVKPLCRM